MGAALVAGWIRAGLAPDSLAIVEKDATRREDLSRILPGVSIDAGTSDAEGVRACGQAGRCRSSLRACGAIRGAARPFDNGGDSDPVARLVDRVPASASAGDAEHTCSRRSRCLGPCRRVEGLRRATSNGPSRSSGRSGPSFEWTRPISMQ